MISRNFVKRAGLVIPPFFGNVVIQSIPDNKH